MPCIERLTEFAKPFRFGNQPCIISVLDYETNGVRGIELSGADVKPADDCGTGGVRLCWLNTKGGIDSFIFSDLTVWAVAVAGGKTAIDGNDNEFTFDRGAIREVVQVRSEALGEADLKALVTITKSPHVWIRTATTDIPVIADEGEFPYSDSDNPATRLTLNIRYGQIERSQLR